MYYTHHTYYTTYYTITITLRIIRSVLYDVFVLANLGPNSEHLLSSCYTGSVTGVLVYCYTGSVTGVWVYCYTGSVTGVWVYCYTVPVIVGSARSACWWGHTVHLLHRH